MCLFVQTASEPLTMEEEIEMQQSWRDDENKCTFIVLATELIQSNSAKLSATTENESVTATSFENPLSLHSTFVSENLIAMVGDCNLFFHAHDEDDEIKCAELDIMIAENTQRRNGLGTQAVCLMMLYGYYQLDIRRYYVKISTKNEGSTRLFKNLGFVERNYVECFQEYEYEYIMINDDQLGSIQAELDSIKIFSIH